VDRDFTASAPNRLWVADFTYVSTWSGVCYVAFVIDVFSRRIVGWKADRTMQTSLVLDTLEMALWARDHAGLPVGEGMIHHSDAGSQLGLKGSSQHGFVLVNIGVRSMPPLVSSTGGSCGAVSSGSLRPLRGPGRCGGRGLFLSGSTV
jgi:hypothetical protein